ncbi:hydrogen peroxide-dependent heme synthase [Nesterenkonia xinjiangensis]|uniref:Coproheme decarboxylase n=1 Tax=Nesterenkonia xinjiangensis TaxID=225327 RepID=A0A7Z0KCS2_9MICC|nr:hydrogen peroxide-dependent heme synthase [Nesterenkonia xinjiangensis]NYJ78907.1 chlorite dismutase [Nesterenkonia xinjiangensis]
MSYGRNAQRTPEEVNASGRDWYTLYTVFARADSSEGVVRGPQASPEEIAPLAEEFDAVVAGLDQDEVILRGVYDVSGMRAEADVMTWLTGHSAEALQAALRRLHRTALLGSSRIVFSALGVHRTAEFARSHVPAFARGVEAEDWLVVYPFNRSYDWYLMDPKKRGALLREHGMLGQEFPSVLANTTSAFALNDWEWLLALESPQLTDLVDMMRRLRESETRYHVRDETPFYTGRRLPTTTEIAEVLR